MKVLPFWTKYFTNLTPIIHQIYAIFFLSFKLPSCLLHPSPLAHKKGGNRTWVIELKMQNISNDPLHFYLVCRAARRKNVTARLM